MTGPGPDAFTMEDFESSTAAGTPEIKPEDIKLGENVPEEMKGKSMKDLVDMVNSLKTGLTISESARKAQESATAAARSASEVSRPTVVAPAAPQITREQLNELFQTDPLAAMATLINLNNGDLTSHIDKRIGSLAGAGTANAQKVAQAEYALEFELFGDDIKDFVSKLGDKSALASSEGWENVVSYVRGKKGNFEKFIEAKTAGNSVANRETARAEQRSSTGPVMTSSRSSTATALPSDLDDTERQIADEFIKSGIIKDHEEYKRWKKS